MTDYLAVVSQHGAHLVISPVHQGIWGGAPAYPDQGLPGQPPGVWPPPGGPGQPPGVWPPPGTPTHPIAPGGRPPGIWGGAPPHPDQGLPVEPPSVDNTLPPVPPGTPDQGLPPTNLPQGALLLLWVPGVGLKWTTLGQPAAPDQGLPPAPTPEPK